MLLSTDSLMPFFKRSGFYSKFALYYSSLKNEIWKVVGSWDTLSYRDIFIKLIDLYRSCFFHSQMSQLGCTCIWAKSLRWTNILWALFQGYQCKWGYTAQSKWLWRTITLSVKFCLCVNLGIYCMAHRACAAASCWKSITGIFPRFNGDQKDQCLAVLCYSLESYLGRGTNCIVLCYIFFPWGFVGGGGFFPELFYSTS